MIISVDIKKSFDKVQHLFMIKALSKIRMEGNFFNFIENIYQKTKPITKSNIVLNCEKLDNFTPRLGKKNPQPRIYLISYQKLQTVEEDKKKKKYKDLEARNKTNFVHK